MTDIKPIQTRYNGYMFRSRLEARWAVFFDEMGIKYEYEPEGFVLTNSDKYLPDFYLPDCRTYVEIKSAGAIQISVSGGRIIFRDGRESAAKYSRFAEDVNNDRNYMIVQGDPLDAFKFTENESASATVFYCPFISFNQTWFETFGIRHRDLKAIVGKPVLYFVNYKPFFMIDMMDDLVLPNHDMIAVAIDTVHSYYGIDCDIKDMVYWRKETNRCAELARQARFEHGEGGVQRG